MRSWTDRIGRLLILLLVGGAGLARAQFPRPGPGGPVEATGVRIPDYHPDGTLRSELLGDSAVLEGPFVVIKNVRVEVYEAGRLTTSFWGESCRYDRAAGRLMSDSPVRLTRPGLVVTGDGLDWKRGDSVVTIRRNVRVLSVRAGSWMQPETER